MVIYFYMDRNIDLVSLPKKSFWKLSIPIIAFCIFDAIYGIVDMLWVSQISVEATFALGVSIPFTTLIFALGDSVGQGTNSIMSRFIGSGDYESSYNALIHGMLLGNLIWIAAIVCLLFANGILFYLDQADSYILVFDYLVPIVVFAYIFIFVNIFSETFQAEGNSTVPTVLIIASNILNIILDPIFIFNLNLGIKGAAYATVLSTFLALVVLMYYYFSGRTKIPMSLRYFTFHSYILVEIFKVALPNFIDDILWCICTSFINSILIVTMGSAGPILYSVANKLKTLLVAPVKGFGRALMSVTGHLFGAREFDELESMFKYALRVSVIVTIAVMAVVIVFRNYLFSLFSVTGMDHEISMIVTFGTLIMLGVPFSMISSKMLDGFGKSLYSLLFTILGIGMEMGLVYVLFVMSVDHCVLFGVTVSEVIIALIYFLFLKYLFRNFKRKYDGKDTVKNFENDSPQGIEDEIDEIVERELPKLPSRTPLIIALIAMMFVFLEIISIPFRIHNYYLFISGTVALILGAISIRWMTYSKKPKLAMIGFIAGGLILLMFMKRYGYVAALLYIVAGILVIYIKRIVRMLKKIRLSSED